MCEVVDQIDDVGFSEPTSFERPGAVFRVVEDLSGLDGEEFEWAPLDGTDAVFCQINAVQCRHPGTEWETIDGTPGTVFRIPVGSEVRLLAAETRRIVR